MTFSVWRPVSSPFCCFLLISFTGLSHGFYTKNDISISEVKEKEFSCLGKQEDGYYSDPSLSCAHFHGCFFNETHVTKITFLCPVGYRFEEELQACERSPDCQPAKGEVKRRTRRQVYSTQRDDDEDSIILPYSAAATARIPAYLLDYTADLSSSRSAPIVLMGSSQPRRSAGFSPRQVIVVAPQSLTSRSLPQYLYREAEPQQQMYGGLLTFNRGPPPSSGRSRAFPHRQTESAHLNGIPEPPVIFFPNQPVPPFRPIPPNLPIINRPSSSLEAERGSSEEERPRYPSPETPASGFRPSDSSRFTAPQFHPPRSRVPTRQESEIQGARLRQEVDNRYRHPQSERFVQAQNDRYLPPPRQELDFQNERYPPPTRQESAPQNNRYSSSGRQTQGYATPPHQDLTSHTNRFQNPPRQEIRHQGTRYVPSPPPTRIVSPNSYRSAPTRHPRPQVEDHEDSSEELRDEEEEVRYLPGRDLEEETEHTPAPYHSNEESYKKDSEEASSAQQDDSPRPTYPPPYYYRVHMNPPLKPTHPFASSSTPPPADLGRFHQNNRLQEQQPKRTTPSQMTSARTQENNNYGSSRNQDQGHGSARTQEQSFVPVRSQDNGYGSSRTHQEHAYGQNRHYGNRNQENPEVPTTPLPVDQEEEEEPSTIFPTTFPLTTPMPTPTTDQTPYTRPSSRRRNPSYARARYPDRSTTTTTENPTTIVDQPEEFSGTTEYSTGDSNKSMPNLFGSRVRNGRPRFGRPRQRSTDEFAPRAEASSLDEERFSPTRQLSQRVRSRPRLFPAEENATAQT